MKLGPKGSLNAIYMLDEDMQLFMHAFPDADEGELREQCCNTVLEYEESMQVWEEMKDTGELDSSATDSEQEDELTSEDLLRDLDKTTRTISPPVASKVSSSCIDWPKRVLRQTILVSSIAAEIELNIDRTDWDENCYKECSKLLQQEAGRIKDISEDRGTGEIPVLVDLEVQHWIAEALEGATHASELVGDRITQISVQCTSRDGKRSQNESSNPSPAAKRATGCAGRPTADPLSDSQLERVVRLALGKRVPVAVEASKAVVAYAAAAKASSNDAPRTPRAASEFARIHHPKRRLEPENESENRSPEPTGAGESPQAAGEAQSAPPERRLATAQASPAAPTTPPESAAAPSGATAKTKKKKAKTKAAEASTGTATGAEPKETSPIAEAGTEAPPAAEPPRRKRMHFFPVFGCTWKHTPDNCPTFRDMVPKERLDLIHRKQLCLFCLRHPIGRECWSMGKWPNCTIDGCGKQHHEMLHEVLKAGKPSVPTKKTESPSGQLAAAAGGVPAPPAYLKLLEGLGIDPDTLEVRIRVQGQG